MGRYIQFIYIHTTNWVLFDFYSVFFSAYQGGQEGMGEILGSSSVEGMVEEPRQPISRSLPGGKNPVSVLMEYGQRSGNPIEFIMTGQAGPPHDPR